MKPAIIAIDFVSHKNMHLPFNEGYINTLCHAYPDRKIIFAATAEHCAVLVKSFTDKPQVIFKNIISLPEALNGQSEHNPFFSLPAAKKCWQQVLHVAADETIEQLTILGAASPLLNVFPKKWHKSQTGKLYFVQHNQLATAMNWRSANPIYRYFDYISALKRGLPKNQALLTLELGLEEVIVEIAPKMRGSIVCLEHPVLEAEWANAKPYKPNNVLKVGFTGHCGRGKGLDTFLSLAEKYTGDMFEFHAIGKLNESNAADLDTSILKTEPQRSHLDRDDFVAKLRDMDIICLPLPTTTSYVSSGSIIDAFAALKPLVMTRNQSLTAIEKKYGAFGVLANTANDVEQFFATFDGAVFHNNQQQWLANLEKIRAARSEQALGKTLKTNN